MTVLADFQITGSKPSIVSGSGTTAKYFPRVLGPSIGVAPSSPSATNAAGQLLVPAFDALQGRLFKIRASGHISPLSNYTIDIVGNYGSITSPSYFTLMTFSDSQSGDWWMEATVMGTNIGAASPGPGYLTGAYRGGIAGGMVPLSTIVSQGQNLNFTTGSTTPGMQGIVFGILARVTFATSFDGNSARLYQLQVVAD